ncbi:4318_t:CDS:2, partial [Racocetra fulgida]
SDDELNPIDLTNMIDTFEKFFDFEGAVDPTEFLRIMRQTLGISEQEYRELANEKIRQESDQITSMLGELMDQSKSISSQQFLSSDISESSSRGKMKESNNDIDMDAYMRALDAELSLSKISGSFIKTPQEALNQPLSEDKINNYEYDDDELSEPVNINLNLAKNLLESFKAQEGLPGPVGNIFGRMGVGALPRDDDDDVATGS